MWGGGGCGYKVWDPINSMQFFKNLNNFLMGHFSHWVTSYKYVMSNLSNTNKPNRNIWRCRFNTSFSFLQTINLSGGRRQGEGEDITCLRLYTSVFQPWLQAVSTWQQCHKSSCVKITTFSFCRDRTTKKPNLTIYIFYTISFNKLKYVLFLFKSLVGGDNLLLKTWSANCLIEVVSQT